MLDSGTNILVWHGKEASPFEKSQATMEGHRIASSRSPRKSAVEGGRKVVANFESTCYTQ